MGISEDLRKKLENSVLRLFDENLNEISYNTLELKYYKPKYSSALRDSLTVFLDGEPLTNLKKKKIRVEYKCDCGGVSTIHLSKFLAKTKMSCKKCVETEEKREWHSKVLKRLHKGLTYVKRDIHASERVVYNFDGETEEFKAKYYEHALTKEEFDKIKKYIHSIDGVCTKDTELILIEHDTSKNARKYRQTVLIDGEKHPFQRIYLKCPLCGTVFGITRPLKQRVLSNNFDCKYCYMNNKTFAIKKYREGLTYQSKMELEFIKSCDKIGIKITNGSDVEYMMNGVKHNYRIDYQLPEFGYQIELKDNHVWHRRQVESGKWGLKEDAAKEFCSRNKMEFFLLFPEDVESFLNHLERDSLNNGESR